MSNVPHLWAHNITEWSCEPKEEIKVLLEIEGIPPGFPRQDPNEMATEAFGQQSHSIGSLTHKYSVGQTAINL